MFNGEYEDDRSIVYKNPAFILPQGVGLGPATIANLSDMRDKHNSCTMDVIYYASDNKDEVQLDFGALPRHAGICRTCSSAKNTWVHRFDNFQSVPRTFGREGTGFRTDIKHV